MGLRYAGLAVGLLVLAGCEANMSGPIDTTDFGAPPAPIVEPIQPSDPVAVTPLAEGGTDPALEMVEVDPYGGVSSGTGGAGGLTERLPDTCKLDQVRQYQGQSAAAVNGAGLSMPYRVIGPSDIVTQEYNPMRVNFFLDNGGTVDHISCG